MIGLNKRANVYLNSFEFLFFIGAIIGVGAYLNATMLMPILRTGILLLGMASGLCFIGIELFLWILMNRNSKILDITYLLVEVICCVYATIKIPFAGIYVLVGFSLLKDALRISFVNKLYIPKEFDYYCKMFNIKVKDFPKKSVSKKQRVPEGNLVVEITKKESKVVHKKTA